MSRRKPHSEHANHDRWLVSYADFITLLFAFFVVMFASSQTDHARAKQVSESVKKALEGENLSQVMASILGGSRDNRGVGSAQMKGPGGAKKAIAEEHADAKMVELLPSMELLRKELEEEIRSGRMQVSMGVRGLTISFQQAALFPSGEDVIAPDAYRSIEKVAGAVRKIPNPMRFEGHTDAIPIHTARFHSNWELSAARSIALMDLLSTRFAVSNARMAIAGYADTAPVAENETELGRSRNRRVDIVILNETGLRGEPERPKTNP